MKSELEIFRTRWLRWLGQKTRCDKEVWTELLDCNWSGWASKVIDRAELNVPRLSWKSTRSEARS